MIKADWPSLVAMFFAQAERFGERPFLWKKVEGQYTPQTWREIAARVSALARGLINLGVGPGDRVMLVSENRPAWMIADLAIMAAGGITVPAYTTNTVLDHCYILENSGARGIIASTGRLAERINEAASKSPGVSFIIAIDRPETITDRPGLVIRDWKEVIAEGDRSRVNIVSACRAISAEDPACIIHTSGTGGTPKGVVLPHRAILHNCAGAVEVLQELGLDEEVFLSFLPLSHAYEHTVGQFVPIAIGAQLYYAESAERMGANMLEAKPTIVSAVPRFYELIQNRVLHAVAKGPGWQRRLFDATLALGRKRWRGEAALNPLELLADGALDRLYRRRVHARFGGRLKAMVSGGAPLDPEVALFFRALGVPIFQGYGQTEAGPLISVNRPSRPKLDTVGPPLRGVETRIAADGGIIVRGPMVMTGYWRNPQATAEVLREGWLHTGDIGEIDADGHIRITDRKKDIIVNSGGDNIAPARVEALLCQRPEIGQAIVFGDRQPHLIALLVPDQGWLETWAATAGKRPDLAILASDGVLHQALAASIEEVNRRLSIIEKIRRFAVLPQAFSIDNGQLTPTLKIRRHIIGQAYAAIIDRLYG